MKGSFQQSSIGRAEATITLKSEVLYYPLPVGCRQFLLMERRDSTGLVLSRIRTKPLYDESYAVEVISGNRGIRISPVRFQSANEDWVLIYTRGPGLLHYANAKSVEGSTVVSEGVTDDIQGRLVTIDDYYNGLELTIYDAEEGAPQTREILTSRAKGRTFHVRHPFDPVKGSIKYEIRPCLPQQHEDLFAMDVAILYLGIRGRSDKVNDLVRHRQKMWIAARAFFYSNVAARGPERLRPINREDLIPSVEIPYYFLL